MNEEKQEKQEKEKTVTGLGEAMGVIIALFLLLPFAAVTLRATADIVNHPTCQSEQNDR